MPSTNQAPAADDPLIGVEEVCKILDCHPSTIFRYVTKSKSALRRKFARPEFPRPVRGAVGNRLAWRRSQIDQYIASRVG